MVRRGCFAGAVWLCKRWRSELADRIGRRRYGKDLMGMQRSCLRPRAEAGDGFLLLSNREWVSSAPGCASLRLSLPGAQVPSDQDSYRNPDDSDDQHGRLPVGGRLL